MCVPSSQCMTADELANLVSRHVSQLSEHFDAVQIMASWLGPDQSTGIINKGSGNWYARHGMAQEFVDESAVRAQAFIIADELHGDAEDEA